MSSTGTEMGGKDLLLKVGNNLSGNAATFTAASDQIGITGHGLSVGDVVRFSAVVTSTVPAANTTYYVIQVIDVDTVKVSATVGGTTINIDADGTGTSEEAFQTLGGLRTKSISLNAEEVDVTNHDSNQWKTLLSGAGIKSVALSADGVFKDDWSAKRVRGYFDGQYLRNYRLCTNSDGDYWGGCFKITSLEQSGDYNAESAFSIAMSSSGSVSYTEV